jgi:hypothetical protein
MGFLKQLAPNLPRPRTTEGCRCQVFHNAAHLTQKASGFKRRFGRIRNRQQVRDDNTTRQVMRREYNWAI